MKIYGVRKICTLSKKLRGTGKVLHILYDTKRNAVWNENLTDDFVNNLKKWEQHRYIYIGCINRYVSMETIKNMVLDKLREINLKNQK